MQEEAKVVLYLRIIFGKNHIMKHIFLSDGNVSDIEEIGDSIREEIQYSAQYRGEKSPAPKISLMKPPFADHYSEEMFLVALRYGDGSKKPISMVFQDIIGLCVNEYFQLKNAA